jgi:hypothetical protein
MIRRLLTAISRMARSKPPAPVTDEMIRRETARATSDLANRQGGL